MTHENKFGMFVHWGAYALTGVHEQAIARLDMSHEEYDKLVKQFNPVDYDPKKWVLLAKEAGMQYICLTVKHHDGFCMWNTKYTDYNIMNTPYGKDVLKMLAETCAKHGMRLSLYYSNPDWHHEYGYNPASSHQWKCVQTEHPDLDKYRAYIKAQITELLTNYGPIYTFFWDIPPRVEDPSLNELIRKLQPGIYINDRGWDKGDFSTPEREYQSPDGARFERMTEACNSLGEQSWAYREKEDFYTKRHICTSIDRIMAMGGSYLLNVGPDPLGVIPAEQVKRLCAVGDWYRRMGGALECHEADPFAYKIRHNAFIATKKDGKTYLHFYNGLVSSAVAIEHYPARPRRIRLLNTDADLPFAIERLPEFFNGATGRAEIDFLHVTDIPADALCDEPIVLEIEW